MDGYSILTASTVFLLIKQPEEPVIKNGGSDLFLLMILCYEPWVTIVIVNQRTVSLDRRDSLWLVSGMGSKNQQK